MRDEFINAASAVCEIFTSALKPNKGCIYGDERSVLGFLTKFRFHHKELTKRMELLTPKEQDEVFEFVSRYHTPSERLTKLTNLIHRPRP